MDQNSQAHKPMIHASFHLRHKHINNFTLDVDLTIPSSGVTAIFGPSGSGKTTFLRCLAGLDKSDSGELHVGGDIWQSASTFIPTYKRPIGYVFQESSLFTHLTVQGNLNYARKRAKTHVSKQLYERAIEIMGIEDILNHFPHQLSGGERQRVAIARAVLIQPQLLLMDEPLASLDKPRKQEIIPYLERLASTLDIPIIYVSHSIDEISRLADHIIVLNQGKSIAQGPLTDVLSRIEPAFNYGEESGVVLQGQVIARDTQWHLACIELPEGALWVRDKGNELNQSVRIRILARDVSLALTPHTDSSILNILPVEISEIAEDTDPAMVLIRLKVTSVYLLARLTRKSVAQLHLSPGKHLWAQIKSGAILS